MIEALPYLLKILAAACAMGAAILWVDRWIEVRWTSTANAARAARTKEQFGGWSKFSLPNNGEGK